MKKLILCLLVLAMAASAALADTITLDGTVISTETAPVVSPVEGVLANVYWHVGDHVAESDEAAALYAVGVRADQSGTVRVMGTVGESVEALVSRYGAVVYVEPDCAFTISLSTRYAYDVEENKVIHPGEMVYLQCSSSNPNHTGIGRVTKVSGNDFTVEVTEGDFERGETVYAYRTDDHATNTRIGRGTAEHSFPVAYTGTGTGRVCGIAVADGAHVDIGALLYETVETANAYAMVSGVAGTVAAVRVAAGDAIAQGTVLADIYPDEAMRIEISVSENDLRDLGVGTRVSIEFTSGETADGEIERISGIAQVNEDAEDDTVYFSAYVRFDASETVRYGMTAKVTTVEDDAQR